MRELTDDEKNGLLRHFQNVFGSVRKCANCKYRSDGFTSVCVNPDSPKRADFVDAEYACEHWEKRE